MKLPLAISIFPIVTAILACTGGTTTPEAPPAPVEAAPAPVAEPVPAAPAANPNLPAPFSTMGLPVNSGIVVEATADHILIIWEGSTKPSAELTAEWQLAMTTAGYVASETVDTGDPMITAVVYKTATSAMGLATGLEDGMLFAYVEDITTGTSESVVRKGGRPGVGARRGGGGGGGGGGEGKIGKAGREGKVGKAGKATP